VEAPWRRRKQERASNGSERVTQELEHGTEGSEVETAANGKGQLM